MVRGPRSVAVIVAHDRRRAIGRDRVLPWHEPRDLARFKRLTMGHALVMGRVTHESIGRALPGRRNLVLSRNPIWAPAAGCEVFDSLSSALGAVDHNDALPFVIGGEAVFREALKLATHLFVTEIDVAVEGADTHFPEYRNDDTWCEVEREELPAGDRPALAFVDYVRNVHKHID